MAASFIFIHSILQPAFGSCLDYPFLRYCHNEYRRPFYRRDHGPAEIRNRRPAR
jgi:hypothetical protein